MRNLKTSIKAEILTLVIMFREVHANVTIDRDEITASKGDWHTHYIFPSFDKKAKHELDRMRRDLIELYDKFCQEVEIMTHEEAKKQGIDPMKWFYDKIQEGNKTLKICSQKDIDELKGAFRKLRRKVC